MIQIPKGSPSYYTALNTTGKTIETSGAPVAKHGACAPAQLTMPAPPSQERGVAKSLQPQSFAARAAANYVKASKLLGGKAAPTFWSKALDPEFAESARAAVAALSVSTDDM